MTYMASHGSTPYKDSKLSPKNPIKRARLVGLVLDMLGSNFSNIFSVLDTNLWTTPK